MRNFFSMTAVLVLAVLIPCVSAQQTWTDIPAMPTPRAFASAAVLNGQIYVMGGIGSGGQVLEVVERYNPQTQTWSTVDELRDAVHGAAATILNGRILLTGGREDDGEVTDDVQAYDASEDDWESFAHMEGEREGHAAFTVNNTAYVFGGSNQGGTLLDGAEVYEDGDWNDYGSWTLEVPRASFSTVTYQSGVIVFGGYSTFGPLADVEFYEPDQGGIILADLPEPRGGLTGALASNKVLAIGGRNASDNILARVDVYDPTSDQWSSGTALPEPREGAAAVAINNTVYVFGGRTDSGLLVTTSLSMAVGTANEELPTNLESVRLLSANPFSSDLAFSVSVSEPSPVTIAIYDMLGRKIQNIESRMLAAGSHRYHWNGSSTTGRDVPAGTYLIRIQTDRASETLQVTRVR